jgi:hypothetical protein
MKISILAILLSSTAVFATMASETSPAIYTDFGIQGKQYDIKEENIMDMIKTNVKAFKSDINVQKTIESELLIRSTGKTSLPLCLKDFNKAPEPDYFSVPEDVLNPVGRKVLSKGELIKSKLKSMQILDLCFVDGRNKIVLDNQIISMLKTNPKCTFMVSDESVLDVRKRFENINIFPTSEQYEKRFGVKCYPTIIHMEEDTKQIKQISYEKYKN